MHLECISCQPLKLEANRPTCFAMNNHNIFTRCRPISDYRPIPNLHFCVVNVVIFGKHRSEHSQS